MKAVVFAYHDMGCAGIQSLLDAGYDIAIQTAKDKGIKIPMIDEAGDK